MAQLRLVLTALVLVVMSALVGGCALFDSFWSNAPSQEGVSYASLGDGPLWPLVSKDKVKKAANACGRDLTPQEAKQLAQKALQKAGGAQQLKALLEGKGKKLKLDKAIGCKVLGKKKKQANPAFALDMGIEQGIAEEEVGSLIEIPAGDNAALYVNEVFEESESWASIKEGADAAERLIHFETVVNDAGDLALDEAHWTLPDAAWNAQLVAELQTEVTQALAVQSGKAQPAGVGSRADPMYNLFIEQASDPTLVWSEAEVIVDEQAEEFVLFVPDAESLLAPASLWGSLDRALKDTGISLTSRVKAIKRVQDNITKWEVARDEVGKPQVQTVNRTSAYQPTFELCPYQYYGSVVRFERVLCQGSWNEWYSKQQLEGKTNDSTLQAAYHPANLKDLFTATYAEDSPRALNVMFSGFKNLDQATIKTSLDTIKARESAQALDPAFLNLWNTAQTLAQSVDPADRDNWLKALFQGAKDGRFDEEYERILAEGFNKYLEVLSVLAKNDSATALKEAVRKAADQFNQASPEMPLGLSLFFENSGSSSVKDQILAEQDFIEGTLKNLFFDLQALYTAGELVPGLGEALTILGFIGLVTDGQPMAPLELVQDLIDKWSETMLLMSLSSYSPEQLLQFSKDFSAVIRGLFDDFVFDNPIPIAFTAGFDDYVEIGEVWGFLNWFVTARGVEGNERADQVWGTINVAANSIQQGWLLLGFLPSSYQPVGDAGSSAMWWGTVLETSKDGPNNRKILTVARGENCNECFKSSEIVQWTARAIEIVQEPVIGNKYATTGLRVISIAFTRPGAKVDAVLARLQQDSRIADSYIPVLVSWQDASGQVLWQCVGRGCGQLTSSEAQLIACNQQGKASNCDARKFDGASTASSETGDQLPAAVISTPPATNPPLFCSSGVCAI